MAIEFNFKSQIATSREQSEKLLALGLKAETADMAWLRGHEKPVVLSNTFNDKEYGCIPAWSLHRLIEICDTNPHVIYTNHTYWGVIDRIEEYIKEGFIDARYMNEGYLEEE